jgi:hypothetical protein
MTFTCPFCGFESHNPTDQDQKYCVNCHVFVEDILASPPGVRRAMARFHRRFAETHPDEQVAALRAAAAWEPKD